MAIGQSIGEFELQDAAVTSRKLGAQGLFISMLGSAAPLVIAAGSNVWTDIPNTPANIIPFSNTKYFASCFQFSGYATGAAGLLQARLLINGVQAGPIFNFFYNTLLQHQSWSWNTYLAEANAGFAIGASIVVKIQVQSPTGQAVAFNMDAGDSWSWAISEHS